MGARAAVGVLAVTSVLGWGVAAGLGAALLVGRDAAPSGSTLGPAPAVSAGPASDTYALSVHDDGCGVIRTEGPGGEDLGGLAWVVTDADGFQVMGRNALGETRYRYFTPGTYDVVLESWGGDSDVDVSNTVTISC